MNDESHPVNPSRREALRAALVLSAGAVAAAIPSARTLAAPGLPSVELNRPARAGDTPTSEAARMLYL